MNLTPSDIILTLRDYLTPYVVTEQRGLVSVANNPFEVIELLSESFGKFRTILTWAGDEDSTGYAIAGIVHTFIEVVVSSNRGMRIWKGENLHTDYGPEGNRQVALVTRVDEVRKRLRAYQFPAEVSDEQLMYLGCRPEVTPEGWPLDAYRLRFRLTTALPTLD
jgi:hypothetical protein